MNITQHTVHIQQNILTKLNYLLYSPLSENKESMPLLLYLHGSGQCGNDLELVKKDWPPVYYPNIPMLILAPQNPAENTIWEVHAVKKLLDKIVEEYRIDTSRIYITGKSMGAYGMWEMMIKYPDVFAAAVSVCHGGYTNRAYRIKHIPVWLFHGAKDTLVDPGYSLRMAQALVEAESQEVHFTLYPDADHDAWTPTYSNPEVYKWLLKNKLSNI